MADLFANEPVSLQDMLGCARREASMRRKVYPGWVMRGRMTEDEAKKETGFMEAIVQHFEAELAKERSGP